MSAGELVENTTVWNIQNQYFYISFYIFVFMISKCTACSGFGCKRASILANLKIETCNLHSNPLSHICTDRRSNGNTMQYTPIASAAKAHS